MASARKKIGITHDDLLAYIVDNPNKVAEIEETLGYGKFPDVASPQKEIEDLSLRVESGFKKIHHLVEISSLSSGFVPETELGKEVVDNGTEITFPLNITQSIKGRALGSFSETLGRDASEKEIQDYFMSKCNELENFEPIKKKLKLIVKDTRQSLVLGTRKPDFVFIQKNTNVDYLNIMAICEVKKRFGENFSNAQIGQAISFGEKLLQLQPRRSSVLVLLTNCFIINIYRVTRVDFDQQTRYKYEFVPPQHLYNSNRSDNGWKYLVTIMESSPQDLGWVEPSLKFGNNTVILTRSISVGRTSVVYEGKYNGKSVAVKMAKKANYYSYFDRERRVLENLSSLESPHIPKILFYNEDTLVMTPLGEKINNLRKEDVRDIITTLQNVHSLSILHRDLRKFNFLRNLNDLSSNILIVDWGYSMNNSESTLPFAGALECMPDYVLQSLINEEEITYKPQVDLICFVRSFYLMFHKPSLNFGKDDDIKQRAGVLLNFWKNCRRSDIWDNVYNTIEALDYEQLIQQLEELF
ncbi:kinase-like domain-containing protein [Rhizophagus diaphanus]|nr:kinase-like domain-containing protein [Rhizophagus diaphanus] [Rhizophagus sp. MUCL 43196]